MFFDSDEIDGDSAGPSSLPTTGASSVTTSGPSSVPTSGSRSLPKRNRKKPQMVSKKVPWTSGEMNAVKRFFASKIRLREVPGKVDCEAAKSAEPELANRPWQKIKFCVHNLITSNRK